MNQWLNPMTQSLNGSIPTCHLPLTTCSCGSARYTSTAYCLTMWQPPSAQVQASIDPREMSAKTQPALVRAIGRWSLVALVLHSIIGSGVFALPSLLPGLGGGGALRASPAAAPGVGVTIAG